MAVPTATITDPSELPEPPQAPADLKKEAADLVSNMRRAWVRSGDSALNRIPGFLPHTPATSPLLAFQKEIMGGTLPSGPDVDIGVKGLKTLIENQQNSLVQGFGFDSKKWDDGFAAVNANIEKSKTSDPSDANVKACKDLQENLKKLQNDKVNEEMRQFMSEADRQYETANFQRIFQQAIAREEREKNSILDFEQQKAFLQNMSWEKLTGTDGEDLQDEIKNSEGEENNNTIHDGSTAEEIAKKQKTGYGVYRAKGSDLNILFHEVNGVPTCQATNAKPEISGLRMLTNLAVDVGELYIRAPTMPLQAGLAYFCQVAGIMNKEGGPKIPYPTIGTFTRGSLSGNKPQTMGDKVREQMNFMAAHAKADKLTFGIPTGDKQASEYHVRNAFQAMIEAQKRAGYDPKGNPKIKNPEAAMQLSLTPEFQAALATSNAIKGVLPEVRNYLRLHGINSSNDSVKVLFQHLRDMNTAIAAAQEKARYLADQQAEKANFAQATQGAKPAPDTTYPAPQIPAANATATITPAAASAPLTPSAPPGGPEFDALGTIRAGQLSSTASAAAPDPSAPPPDAPDAVADAKAPPPAPPGAAPAADEKDDLIGTIRAAGDVSPPDGIDANGVLTRNGQVVQGDYSGFGVDRKDNQGEPEPIGLDGIDVKVPEGAPDAKGNSNEEIEMANLGAAGLNDVVAPDDVEVKLGNDEVKAAPDEVKPTPDEIKAAAAAAAVTNKQETEDMQPVGEFLEQTEQDIAEEEKAARIEAGLLKLNTEVNADATEKMDSVGDFLENAQQSALDDLKVPAASEIEAGQAPVEPKPTAPELDLSTASYKEAEATGKLEEWADAMIKQEQATPDPAPAANEVKPEEKAAPAIDTNKPAPQQVGPERDAWVDEVAKKWAADELAAKAAAAKAPPLPTTGGRLSALSNLLENIVNANVAPAVKAPAANTPAPTADAAAPRPPLNPLRGVKLPGPTPEQKAAMSPAAVKPAPGPMYMPPADYKLNNKKPIVIPKPKQPQQQSTTPDGPGAHAAAATAPKSSHADDLARTVGGILQNHRDAKRDNKNDLDQLPHTHDAPASTTPRRGSKT